MRPFRNSRIIVYADAFDKYKKGGTFNISGAVPMLLSEHPQCTSRVIFQPYQYDETHRDLGTTTIKGWLCSQWGGISAPNSEEKHYKFKGDFNYANTEVEASGNIGGISKSFRIVTDIEDTIVITGSGDILQKKAIAKKVILMHDATFESWDNAIYYAGENIYIAKETDMPAGAEVYYHTNLSTKHD